MVNCGLWDDICVLLLYTLVLPKVLLRLVVGDRAIRRHLGRDVFANDLALQVLALQGDLLL